MAALQNEINAGWEPISEVGPSAIELRYARDHRGQGCSYMTLMTLDTAGLWLLVALFDKDSFAEPNRVVVQMRRRI